MTALFTNERDHMARPHKHGLARTPEHRIWTGLRNRCLNPNNRSYPNYGGRGIAIDPSWNDFVVFLKDMGRRPSSDHTIERRDTNGPYSAQNCFWATRLEQANNKRTNVVLEFEGRRQTIAAWARETGIPHDTIEMRIGRLGWAHERALTTPNREWGPGRPKNAAK